MPDVISEIISSILKDYIISIIVLATLAILNKRIYRLGRYIYAYVTDKPIRMRVELDQQYKKEPKSLISNEIFDGIVQYVKTDRVTKGTINPHFMQINSDKLGMGISISLSEEHDTSTVGLGEQATILSYYLIIKADAELIGIRRIDHLQDFVNIAMKVAQAIKSNCFEGTEPEQSYVLCDIKDLLRTDRRLTYDNIDLEARVSLHDKVLTITSKEPNNLVRIIRKCLQKHI